MALMWEERFHSSAQLCELQWQLWGKEAIYKKAELILCVPNMFPFSCASPKPPLLKRLLLGEAFVRAQRALGLGGRQDNECHKLFLKAWLLIYANICVLHSKALGMILPNGAIRFVNSLKGVKRGNFPLYCCCYLVARASLLGGSQGGQPCLGPVVLEPGTTARNVIPPQCPSHPRGWRPLRPTLQVTW